MFNLKIQQFRTAILQLFGFEINWKDKCFRLRPAYAESEEDVFVFQESPKGLQMLDAPYCNAPSHSPHFPWTSNLNTHTK